MGTDIDGWVEIRRQRDDGYTWWDGIIKVYNLVERNYAMFGSLFGYFHAGGLSPIAADRGMPSEISDEVSYDKVDQGGVRPTWMLSSEIEAINWDEEGSDPVSDAAAPTKPIRRRDLLTPGWWVLFDMIDTLAETYGSENVRLVVWFDQ